MKVQQEQPVYSVQEVQPAAFLSTLATSLMAIGMVVYFLKAGPSEFFKGFWEK